MPECTGKAWTSCRPRSTEHVQNVFEHDLYPVLSPISVEDPDDLPLLPGLTLHLAVRLKPSGEGRKPRYAVVTLPKKLGRFITLPIDEGHNYALVEDVIGLFVDRLFPGEPVAEWAPFRITRNADLGVREDLASDLLEEMKEVLSQRKQSACVRLEISDKVSKTMLAFLQGLFRVNEESTYACPARWIWPPTSAWPA
jgi:polyphosphate kinase